MYESKEHANLVFELMKGGDLHDRIKAKGAFSEKLSLSIFQQIAQGLAYLHENKIVHRDIKLDNVFLVYASFIHLLIEAKVQTYQLK